MSAGTALALAAKTEKLESRAFAFAHCPKEALKLPQIGYCRRGAPAMLPRIAGGLRLTVRCPRAG